MKYRTVVMYMEIGCFVSCVCGWILVCSTLPTEYWTFSEVGSIVLTTSNYYSNLWRDCISDTTGVSDCKDYPSMLALPGRIHRKLLNIYNSFIFNVKLKFSTVEKIQGLYRNYWEGEGGLNHKFHFIKKQDQLQCYQYFISNLPLENITKYTSNNKIIHYFE